MSGPVSYASAARLASNSQGAKDSQQSTRSTTPTAVDESPVATTGSIETNPRVSSATAAAETVDTPQPSELEMTKDTSSLREKLSLTPAPLPKVNAWGVKPTPVSAPPIAEAPSPHSSSPAPASDEQTDGIPLDPNHWPKPEVASELKDQSLPASSAAKVRPGKGKWVPLNIPPIATKPRNNKSARSGNSSKSSQNHNNSASASGSNSSNANGSTPSKSRSTKNYASKVGSQKKPDSKPAKTSQKPASASAAPSGSKTDTTKPKTTTNSAPAAPGKGTVKKDSTERASNGTQQHANGFHQNHHGNNFHHHHHNNNGHQQRSQSVPNQNQYFPHNNNSNNNTRRSSQMQYNNNFFVPDYPMYAPMFNGAPPSQYEITLSNVAYQVEYYFSVENLCKDMYLRKQMNSNGWIPLTILASFNRLKALTGGDFNLFVEACKWAPSVEVLGDKIRARYNHALWVFPVADRLEAGKDEESPSTPKLKFNPAEAAPFVPKLATPPAPSSQ